MKLRQVLVSFFTVILLALLFVGNLPQVSYASSQVSGKIPASQIKAKPKSSIKKSSGANLRNGIVKSKKNASRSKKKKSGIGAYSKVGGHHIHAKAAFKNNISYTNSSGFSISKDYMDKHNLNHTRMTNYQRKAFKELSKSGRKNSMKEHTRIAVNALIAGGATKSQARKLVAKSLEELRSRGVKIPTNIPWYQ